jgi:ubiquinone biosynthesis protein COQ4
VEPLKALAAVRALIRDKEDTVQVFEIMRALSGRSIPKGYLRLLASPEGGRIALTARELAPLLDDHAALRLLPEGSVGRAYLAFVEAQHLSAEGLAAESRKTGGSEIDAEHPYAWYARRLRDVHDIWHVLTGYGRDALGESCVVAFSYAQTRSTGFALIAAAGALEIGRRMPGQPVRQAVWQAYQHGRKAAWLPAVDYPALLALPLEQARQRLSIAPPTHYGAIPPHLRDGVR